MEVVLTDLEKWFGKKSEMRETLKTDLGTQLRKEVAEVFNGLTADNETETEV